jgi:hypothetical protein
MIFRNGALYERTIETPTGAIDVLAEIVTDGARIELRDIAVYPRAAGHLVFEPSELLRWVRLALDELSQGGFEELRVTGTRLSGARRGRRVDILIRLQRKRP